MMVGRVDDGAMSSTPRSAHVVVTAPALTAAAVAATQRRTRRVLMAGQVLAGLGMGATLSIGAILAAEISGSPAFSGMAATMVTFGAALAAIPLARWMRSDREVIAVLERAARDPEQFDASSAWGLYALLGPRLRADPRLQPTFRALGFPETRRGNTKR